jgi:hypothetical protein
MVPLHFLLAQIVFIGGNCIFIGVDFIGVKCRERIVGMNCSRSSRGRKQLFVISVNGV